MIVFDSYVCVRNSRLLVRRISSVCPRSGSSCATFSQVNSYTVTLPCLADIKTRRFSGKTKNSDSFTVSYLVNSCGLSKEAAIAASEKVKFETPARPASVVALLRNHGFSKTQIAYMVRKRPGLLLARPENTLLPKFQFFQSIGFSSADLPRTLSLSSNYLTKSLEKKIIPSYNFLKSVLLSDTKVVMAIKRTSWVLDYKRNLAPNIAKLREHKVPEPCIALLLAHFPEALVQRQDEFIDKVYDVKAMGFDPSKSTFVLAVHAISGKSNKLIWDRCNETYTKWGWSKDDISSAFKKHPNCMILSTKNIDKTMEFFVKTMGWDSRKVASYPAILFFSLEKRIKPRCSVIQVLVSKGLVNKDLSLSSLFVSPEKSFLRRFVTKYEDEIPQLLSVYQGKMSALDVRTE